jgi:hypothetical protein
VTRGDSFCPNRRMARDGDRFTISAVAVLTCAAATLSCDGRGWRTERSGGAGWGAAAAAAFDSNRAKVRQACWPADNL